MNSDVFLQKSYEKGKFVSTIIDNQLKEIGNYYCKIQFPKNTSRNNFYLEFTNKYGTTIIQINKS